VGGGGGVLFWGGGGRGGWGGGGVGAGCDFTSILSATDDDATGGGRGPAVDAVDVGADGSGRRHHVGGAGPLWLTAGAAGALPLLPPPLVPLRGTSAAAAGAAAAAAAS